MKVQDGPEIACYVRKQGSTQRMMERDISKSRKTSLKGFSLVKSDNVH